MRSRPAKFLYAHRVLFGAAALALAVFSAFLVCFFALSQTASSLRLTVVIDAGHGGVDGGVTGVTTGVKESDVNLAYARALQEAFEDAGFRVVQTRPTEAGLYGVATAGYKKRDMLKRGEIINKSAPVLMISVHQNYFSQRARRGAQVFFRESSETSRALARAVQTSLNGMPECVKRTEALAGDYYVLNCSDYPSVIVECGFLSNEEDEKLLLDANYREKLVSAVLAGALSYLSDPAAG